MAERIYASRFYRELRGFESSRARQREVVQWQDVGFWSQLRVFDSLPRGQVSVRVIQRQDGLLIRAPPGFDSQRRNHGFAFEAHEDEQAALNRQAVSSILTGRTRFGENRSLTVAAR